MVSGTATPAVGSTIIFSPKHEDDLYSIGETITATRTICSEDYKFNSWSVSPYTTTSALSHNQNPVGLESFDITVKQTADVMEYTVNTSYQNLTRISSFEPANTSKSFLLSKFIKKLIC